MRVDASKKLADNFYNLIKNTFPKKSTIKGVELHGEIISKKDGSNTVTQSQQRITNYRFEDENQKKLLMLEPLKDINLVLKVYKNSNDLKDIIKLIIDAIIDVYGDIKIKRTGLRYINDINIIEGNPFDWSPFINHSLISCLNFLSEDDRLARSMGIIELNREDHKVLFQFGMYNPEYPNSIAKKVFVLDYDCYTTDELNASEIIKIIEILQQDEEELFERSIEEGLREKMGVITDDRSS